jgi:hypothetical protein
VVVQFTAEAQDMGHGRARRVRARRVMVTAGGEYCDKCKRRNPIAYRVEPEEAWKTVVLNRWRKLCPSCFDQLAEQAGVAYAFTDLEARSWSDRPAPRSKPGRKR